MFFMSNDNIKLLWELIKSYINNEQLHIENMKNFCDYNKILNFNLSKEQMIYYNKEYISTIIKSTQNNFIKNKPYTIEEKEPYTFEEIKNIKRESFNNEFNKKKQEFSNMINNNVPPVPLKFNEEMDKPINEMEKLISKTIAERTLEIEQITKNNPPPDSSKFIQINDMIPNNINSIQLDDKKHISWNDNNEYYNNNSLEERIMRLEEKMDVIINLLKK